MFCLETNDFQTLTTFGGLFFILGLSQLLRLSRLSGLLECCGLNKTRLHKKETKIALKMDKNCDSNNFHVKIWKFMGIKSRITTAHAQRRKKPRFSVLCRGRCSSHPRRKNATRGKIRRYTGKKKSPRNGGKRCTYKKNPRYRRGFLLLFLYSSQISMIAFPFSGYMNFT